MFRVNVDYISYHVTLKLRRVERNPGVLDVINVVTNYSTMDFLPHLKDIVDDLLLQSGSNLQKRNAQSFLKVFYSFTICVKRLTVTQNLKEKEKSQTGPKTSSTAEIIVSNFLEFYEAKKSSEILEDNEELEKDLQDNDEKQVFHEGILNFIEKFMP